MHGNNKNAKWFDILSYLFRSNKSLVKSTYVLLWTSHVQYSFAIVTEKKICVRELITQPFKDLKCNLLELKKYDNVSNCQVIYLLSK